MTGLQKQVQQLKAANSVLSSKVDAQEKKTLQLRDRSTTFVWRVDGFGNILKKAKRRNNAEIFSEPFYTVSQGYKLQLCIHVHPDSDQPNANENRYLSVYIAVMKGKFDAILPWPIHQRVKFTLIDQQDDPSKREDVVTSFITDPSWPLSARPTRYQTKMRGFPTFVSHKILKTRRYIVHDTLFLQADISPPD